MSLRFIPRKAKPCSFQNRRNERDTNGVGKITFRKKNSFNFLVTEVNESNVSCAGLFYF